MYVKIKEKLLPHLSGWSFEVIFLLLSLCSIVVEDVDLILGGVRKKS